MTQEKLPHRKELCLQSVASDGSLMLFLFFYQESPGEAYDTVRQKYRI